MLLLFLGDCHGTNFSVLGNYRDVLTLQAFDLGGILFQGEGLLFSVESFEFPYAFYRVILYGRSLDKMILGCWTQGKILSIPQLSF